MNGAVSSSVMVSLAVAGEPSVAPPVGLLRDRFTVSAPSTAVSFAIVTVKVRFAASPLAQLNTPLAAV